MSFENQIVMMELKGLVLCFISLIVFVNCEATRESCIVNQTRRPGICKSLSECKKSVPEFQKKNITICDIRLRLVCCPTPHQTVYPRVSRERISEQKCQEYGTFYTKTVENTNSHNIKFNITTSTCRTIPVIELVFGGEKAQEKEFPHMALIGFGPAESIIYGCGGSLISDQWVLTAGHCYNTSEGLPTFVKLGSILRDENNVTHFEIYPVMEAVPHPEYERGKNDIALLKLDKIVVFNDYIVPICLAQTRNVEIMGTAAGWGVDGILNRPQDLMKVELEIFPRDECTKHYSKNRSLPDGIIDDMMLCAGHRFQSKDTCRGDSGGPLQVRRKDMYCMFTMIGSTSFGHRQCGKIGVPAVYARTYNYLDWIEEIVWPENLTDA